MMNTSPRRNAPAPTLARAGDANGEIALRARTADASDRARELAAILETLPAGEPCEAFTLRLARALVAELVAQLDSLRRVER